MKYGSAFFSAKGFRYRKTNLINNIMTFFLLLAFALNPVIPAVARAQEASRKVVRVGWYESTYCFRDQFGERRGIAYEYQRRIAPHTGWEYDGDYG